MIRDKDRAAIPKQMVAITKENSMTIYKADKDTTIVRADGITGVTGEQERCTAKVSTSTRMARYIRANSSMASDRAMEPWCG